MAGKRKRPRRSGEVAASADDKVQRSSVHAPPHILADTPELVQTTSDLLPPPTESKSSSHPSNKAPAVSIHSKNSEEVQFDTICTRANPSASRASAEQQQQQSRASTSQSRSELSLADSIDAYTSRGENRTTFSVTIPEVSTDSNVHRKRTIHATHSPEIIHQSIGGKEAVTVSEEDKLVELGASVSKKRRRERQRSAVCSSPLDTTTGSLASKSSEIVGTNPPPLPPHIVHNQTIPIGVNVGTHPVFTSPSTTCAVNAPLSMRPGDHKNTHQPPYTNDQTAGPHSAYHIQHHQSLAHARAHGHSGSQLPSNSAAALYLVPGFHGGLAAHSAESSSTPADASIATRGGGGSVQRKTAEQQQQPQHAYLIPGFPSTTAVTSLMRTPTGDSVHFSTAAASVAHQPMPIDLTVSPVDFVQPFVTHGAMLHASSMGMMTHPFATVVTSSHVVGPHVVAGTPDVSELAYQALRDARLSSSLIGHAQVGTDSPEDPFASMPSHHASGPPVAIGHDAIGSGGSTSSGSVRLAYPTKNRQFACASSMIPVLSNADTAPFAVQPAPAVSATDVHPSQSSTLLNPISMARLISLNAAMPSGGHVTKSGSEVTYVRPGHHTIMPPPPPMHAPMAATSTVAAMPTSRYARYPAAQPGNPDYNRAGGGPPWPRLGGGGGGTSHHHHHHHPMYHQHPHASIDRHSPHAAANGINHRISQLQQQQQHCNDRSMQLVILQDINQILLTGYEENLLSLNVHGLVSCVLDILDSDEEQLVELKNLGCNVLTHMMDVLPRSSDAVVPALPLLLTTMSSSFVGDILERIINLLEQLSRRHGREVLQSGGIMSVLGFYDFVTMAQHRTILTMVANCFATLEPSDFDLIVDCLPSLSERLKESEPRCVERVCTCFAHLVAAYRASPTLLKRIVSSCNLFANLQHLLMASPPILTGVRDIVHMLAVLCASCPDLAVDLIQQNISATVHCILTGETVNPDALTATLMAPLTKSGQPDTTTALLQSYRTATSVKRHRSHSGNGAVGRRRNSGSKLKRSDSSMDEMGSIWPPLMLTYSPLVDRESPVTANLTVHKHSPEDVHAVVQLICELLPRIPPIYASALFYRPSPVEVNSMEPFPTELRGSGQRSSLSSLLTACKPDEFDSGLASIIVRSDIDRTAAVTVIADRRCRSRTGSMHRLSIPPNQLVIDEPPSSSSSSSSGTLKRPDATATADANEHQDPRARLLHDECMALHTQLTSKPPSTEPIEPAVGHRTRRRSSGRNQQTTDTTTATSPMTVDTEPTAAASNNTTLLRDQGIADAAMQLVQTLLPLLFDLFTEATKLHTRLRCLEAIQRMLFYSSPLLLAKALRPRVVCNHLVGMLNCPERRVVLAGLHIALLLLDRIPSMFATYFRKEGILHQIDQLRSSNDAREKQQQPASVPISSTVHSSLQQLVVAEPVLTPTRTPSQSSDCPSDCFGIPSEYPHLWTDAVLNIPESQEVVLAPAQADNSTLQEERRRVDQSITTTIMHRSRPDGGRRTPSVVSAPLLSTRTVGGETGDPGHTLCYWIDVASSQLHSRIDAIASQQQQQVHTINASGSAGHATTPNPGIPASPVDHHPHTNAYKLIPGDSSFDGLDSMPKLTAIASLLTSTSPALWVCAFSELIRLLRPSGVETGIPEPPSPFELQNSGVTSALLSYLTTVDTREVRLWIVCRMFFGSRAVSRAPFFFSANSIATLTTKKSVSSSKHGAHLLPLCPMLLNADQARQLHELALFVDRHWGSSGLDHQGPAAFGVLLDCLLACIHRQEHFQVSGLPSTLSADSRLNNLFHSTLITDDQGPSQAIAMAIIEPTEVEHTSQRLHTARKVSTDTQAPIPSVRARHPRGHVGKSSGGHKTSQSARDVWSEAEQTATMAHRLTSRLRVPSRAHMAQLAAPPTSGLVWIDLVRLVDDEDDSSSAAAAASEQGGKSRQGTSSTHSKAGRKSTSSTSVDPPFFVPERFCLQVTALATFQIVERLLFQRNYINSLIQDGLWVQDHDPSPTNLVEIHPHNSPQPDDPFRNFLDAHDFSDDAAGAVTAEDDDDDEQDDGSSGLFQAPSPLHLDQPSTGTLTRSNAPSHRTNQSAPTDLPPYWPASFHRMDNLTLGPSFTGADVQSHVHPDVEARSVVMNHNETSAVPVGTSVDMEPFQRGLRSLLQHTSVAQPQPPPPTATRAHPDRSHPTDMWSFRRRATSKLHTARTPREEPSTSTQVTGRSYRRNPVDARHVSNNPAPVVAPKVTARSGQTAPNSGDRASPSTLTRYRRLRGSSILAAFGALANLSSGTLGVQSQSSGQKPSTSVKPVRSGSNRGATSSARRSFVQGQMATSSSPTSSSSSSASMSPHSAEGLGSSSAAAVRAKQHRYSLVFYVGGHRLPPNLPLFEAIRRFSPDFAKRLSSMRAHHQSRVKTMTGESVGYDKATTLTDMELEELSGHLMWSMTHVIHYRLVASRPTSTDSHTSALHLRKSESLMSTSLSLIKSSDTVSLSSTTTTPSLSSAITCLKRRRSDEAEHHRSTSDSAVIAEKPTGSGGTGPPPRTVAPSSTGPFPTTQHGNHPLYGQLTRHLPKGLLLSETRCECLVTIQMTASTSASPRLCPRANQMAHIEIDESLAGTLSLLRALHNISRLWYTMHDVLDPYPIVSPLAFCSPKLTVKAGRQLQDLFSVLAGNLPAWLVQLMSTCPFLFPFEIRRSFFYAYNFDRDRTLLRFQDSGLPSVSEMEQQITGAATNASSRSGVSNVFLGEQSLSVASSPNSASSTLGTELSPSTLMSAFSSNHSGSGSNSIWSSTSSSSSSSTSAGFTQIPTPPALDSTDSVAHVPASVTGSQRSHHHHPPSSSSNAARGRYHTRLALSPNLKRHKVTAHREGKRLLREAEATLADLLDSRAVLEITFEGEVGFGLGPTLEFYTLVSRELMKSTFNLWHGNERTAEGYVIAPATGLYPRPLARQTRSSVVRDIRSKFLFLGRLLARALLDGRQLDLPFSPAFFKWFLGSTSTLSISDGRVLANDLVLVDPDLGRHIRELSDLAGRRHALTRQLDHLQSTAAVTTPGDDGMVVAGSNRTSSHRSGSSHASGKGDFGPSGHANSRTAGQQHVASSLAELKAGLLVVDNEVEDLCLNFALPGYEIELVKNGSHIMVTGANLGDYIRLVAHWLVIEGAARQMEAVLEGFDSVLPNIRERLAVLFQPDEMEGLFCGRSSSAATSSFLSASYNNNNNTSRSEAVSNALGKIAPPAEGWDFQSLIEACRFDHGYTPQSRTIRYLFEVMSEFDEAQRRLFVQFVTGSPRLPIGGFRALKPQLKIVMKRESGENSDNHLPSVMTCQNYLKLPDYSSKELLHSKLLYAIREGQNAFHLS